MPSARFCDIPGGTAGKPSRVGMVELKLGSKDEQSDRLPFKRGCVDKMPAAFVKVMASKKPMYVLRGPSAAFEVVGRLLDGLLATLANATSNAINCRHYMHVFRTSVLVCASIRYKHPNVPKSTAQPDQKKQVRTSGTNA